MPTGYTTHINDGISFEDFILLCARAFGACIMQRDDNIKDKPKLREPSKYYYEKLEESKKDLAKWESMALSDRVKFYEQTFADRQTEYEKAIKEKKDLQSKYEDMLAKSKAWNPPTTEHQGLKDFMIQQIEDSIKWDCNTEYYEKRLDIGEFEDFDEKHHESLQWDVNYYTKQIQDEELRCKEQNEWIKKLYESVGLEV